LPRCQLGLLAAIPATWLLLLLRMLLKLSVHDLARTTTLTATISVTTTICAVLRHINSRLAGLFLACRQDPLLSIGLTRQRYVSVTAERLWI